MFEQFTGTESYVTDAELRDGVNVAISLEKPLLVRGEPGTGKTLLAHAIAEDLGLPLLTWHVKSTTEAQEGLYVYDTVQRLHDSRFDDGDVGDIEQYIDLGPLGRAFAMTEDGGDRPVLLIDEIDKADMEFPNDLLHELDEMQFTISETQRTVEARKRPIVVITSNAEKELPDAFLRRCVFHYIDFPEPELMREIVDVHHPDLEDELIEQCLKRFYWLRNQAEVRKKPSTSELVDWIAALARAGIEPSRLERELPFMGALLKREEDLESLASASSSTTRSQSSQSSPWSL
jgi:MoxR-like ATPase